MVVAEKALMIPLENAVASLMALSSTVFFGIDTALRVLVAPSEVRYLL